MKIRRAVDFVMEAGRPLVLGYAFLLVVGPFMPLVGQRSSEVASLQQVGDLTRRVELLERMDLEKRLTILETVQAQDKENALWHRGSSVGVGLLIIERVVGMRKRKVRVENEIQA